MSTLDRKPSEQLIDHSVCPSNYWYIDSKQTERDREREETFLVIVGFLQNSAEAINSFQGHCKGSIPRRGI